MNGPSGHTWRMRNTEQAPLELQFTQFPRQSICSCCSFALEPFFMCRILVAFLSFRCAHVQPASPCKSMQVHASPCKSAQAVNHFRCSVSANILLPIPLPSTPFYKLDKCAIEFVIRLQPRLAAQKCNYIASKSLEQPSLCIPQVAAWQPLSQLLRGMSQQSWK